MTESTYLYSKSETYFLFIAVRTLHSNPALRECAILSDKLGNNFTFINPEAANYSTAIRTDETLVIHIKRNVRFTLHFSLYE
jgi:hypothetical protein